MWANMELQALRRTRISMRIAFLGRMEAAIPAGYWEVLIVPFKTEWM